MKFISINISTVLQMTKFVINKTSNTKYYITKYSVCFDLYNHYQVFQWSLFMVFFWWSLCNKKFIVLQDPRNFVMSYVQWLYFPRILQFDFVIWSNDQIIRKLLSAYMKTQCYVNFWHIFYIFLYGYWTMFLCFHYFYVSHPIIN